MALELGDEVVADPAEAAARADLVILCVPVGATRGWRANRAETEAGGDRLRRRFGQGRGRSPAVAPRLPEGVALVPAHPVAGTEQSGPDAGFATLFVNRWCILTPPPTSTRRRSRKCGRSGRRSAPTSRR